jgi:hypothetical protein
LTALRDFHEVFGYVAIVANAIAGLVALAAWQVERWRGRWVWIVTIVAEGMMLLEVVIGVILVASDRYVGARFHMFYGFLAFITVGLAYQYRDSMRNRTELLYGLVGLFMMGLGIRAVFEVMS